MKVLVTGAAGHLAAAVIEAFAPDHEVVALARADLDITDRARVRETVAAMRPDAIVNCAAYNDVDGAQRDPGPSLEINALALIALATAAGDAGAALVHYSTDFVFDGESDRPYRESDPPRPLSFYGCTKLLGERFAADAPRHYVLRVESIFGGPTAGTTAHDGSLGGIVTKLRRGEEAAVFTDRTVSPSYAPDIAAATRHLVERGAEPGLYHCVNRGAASWHAIASAAAAQLGIEARLKPITLDSVALVAPRPRYCALDPSRLAQAGFEMRPWEDAVAAYLRRFA